MKKLPVFLIALCALLIPAHAERKDASGLFTVQLRGDHAVITGCTYDKRSGTRTLSVPAEVDGLPVTAIADYALSSYQNADLDAVERIELPATLRSVGTKAFAYLEGLREIVLPDSVHELGYAAFRDCTALQEVTLPAVLRTVPESCFEGCGRLAAVHVAQNADLERIGFSAFEDCGALETVELPRGLKVIGERAFALCQLLPAVEIPVSVRVILSAAFYRTAIEDVRIPRPVHLATDAFSPGVLLRVFPGSAAAEALEKTDADFVYLPAGSAGDLPEYGDYALYPEPDTDADDDEDDGGWWADDDDDEEDAAPITAEELEDLVTVIVAREESGAYDEGQLGSDGENDVYHVAFDRSAAGVDVADIPYIYYLIPGDEEADVPALLYVIYGRRSGYNQFMFSMVGSSLIEWESEEDLLGDTDLAERYEQIKGYTIGYRSTVTIRGTTYEVYCTDIDED